MENKYYTPELEEFHVGFEYQELWGLENINEEWLPQIYDENDSIRTLCETLRVKCLDREDIESLGWKYVPDLSEGDGNMRWYGLFKLNEFTITLGLIEGSEIIRKGKNTIFEGVIKNKSELKKLMKQLNIL
jgi:hypothetical protein